MRPHLWPTAAHRHTAGPAPRHRSRRNQDRSVAELVVDTQIDHLDVAIVAGELIARRQAGKFRRRNSKGLAVQPDIIILEPRRPIVPESPLDACTQRPAEIAVAGRRGSRGTHRHIGNRRPELVFAVSKLSSSATALAINEHTVPGVTETASQSS